jgi:hypothetical protein
MEPVLDVDIIELFQKHNTSKDDIVEKLSIVIESLVLGDGYTRTKLYNEMRKHLRPEPRPKKSGRRCDCGQCFDCWPGEAWEYMLKTSNAY